MNIDRVSKMAFSTVYPLLVKKAEKKNRTKQEVDEIICWLTGYTQQELQRQLDKEVNYEIFFNEAPLMNHNAYKITGLICGYRVEDIEDSLMQKVRWLDKLIDELAKGRAMDKILRK